MRLPEFLPRGDGRAGRGDAVAPLFLVWSGRFVALDGTGPVDRSGSVRRDLAVSQHSSGKVYLADLVMASLLCGLFIALFTSARAPADAAIVFFLIVVVVTTWTLFHQRRQAPTCEECGRRFIQAHKSI